MPKLHYFKAIVGDGQLLVEHAEAIKALLNGTYAKTDLEKLRGHDVFSYRLNQRARLLFAIEKINSHTCFIVLDYLPTHDYHKSKFLKSKVLKNYLRTQTEIHFEDCEESMVLPKLEFSSPIDWQPVNYYQGQMLVFNVEQEKALSLKLPGLISGAAGSGKSCVALSLLQSYRGTGDIAYVTQSRHLVSRIRESFEALAEQDELARKIHFLTYQDLVENSSEALTYVAKPEFISWYQSKIRSLKKMSATNKATWLGLEDAELAYQEFRIASGYDIETYKVLGERQSLINKEQRIWMYHFYQSYIAHLKKIGACDLAFQDLPQGLVYELLVVDEAQDFSHKQLLELGRLAPAGVAFCMDSHQRLHDKRSIRPFIMQKFNITEDRHVNLMQSYRCAERIVGLTNEIIALKQRIMGGIADKHELTRITKEYNDSADLGHVFFLDPLQLTKNVWLQQQMGQSHLAVVTLPKFIEEAQLLLKTPLVFTSETIKGLEYPIIVGYKLYDREILKPILHLKFEDMKQPIFQAKRGETEEHFGPHFNQIYVAYTRAQRVLIISEENCREHNVLLNLLHPFRSGLAPDSENVAVITAHSDWEAEVYRHLDAGNEELALIIYQSKLKGDAHGFKALIQSRLTLLKPAKLLASEIESPSASAAMAIPVKSAISPLATPLAKPRKQSLYALASPTIIEPKTKSLTLDVATPGLFNRFMQQNYQRKDKGHFWLSPLQDCQEFGELCLADFFQNPVTANEVLKFVVNHTYALFNDTADLKVFKYISKNSPHTAEQFKRLIPISNKIKKLELQRPHFYSGKKVRNDSFINYTPMTYAAMTTDLALINELVNLGANINTSSCEGVMPVTVAVQFGNFATLKLLEKCGANVFYENDLGENLTTIAVIHQQTEMLKDLKRLGVSLNKPCHRGVSPAYLAAQFKYYRVLEILKKIGENLELFDSRGFPLSFIAAEFDDPELIEKLTELGINLWALDIWGENVVHAAAKFGSLRVLKKLQQYGADYNILSDSEGISPLMKAAGAGQIKALEFLLPFQKDIHHYSCVGFNAIQYAAHQGHPQVLDFFMRRGYDVLQPNPRGETVATIACKEAKTEILVFLHQEKLLTHQPELKTGLIPLSYAVMANHLTVMRFYESIHYDFNQKVAGGYNHAYFAAQSGSLAVLKFLEKKIMHMNERQPNGCMLAHVAAKEGHLPILKYLNSIQIDLHEKTSAGESIASLAVKYRQPQVLEFAYELDIDLNEELLDIAIENADTFILEKLFQFEVFPESTSNLLPKWLFRCLILEQINLIELFKDKLNFNFSLCVHLDDPIFLNASVSKDFLPKLLQYRDTLALEEEERLKPLEMPILDFVKIMDNPRVFSFIHELINSQPQKFMYALKKQDIPALLELSKQGFDFNQPIYKGKSAFYLSIQMSYSMFELILELGGSPNARMTNGETSLFSALHSENIEIIQKLCSLGADVNIQRRDEFDVLSLSVHKSLVVFDTIINSGVNLKNIPLCIFNALYFGRLDIINRLIELEVDFNQQFPNGLHLIHFIVNHNLLAALAYLHERGKIDLYLVSSAGMTMAMMAADIGNMKIIQYLAELKIDLNFNPRKYYSLATLAIKKANFEMLELLAKLQVDFNFIQENGRTPLLELIYEQKIEVLIFVLQLNVININLELKDGVTAAHHAAKIGNFDIIRILHRFKADFNKADILGITPLHEAARSGHADTISEILSYGIDINFKSNRGTTPLFLAISNNHVNATRTLLCQGADLNQLINSHGTCALTLCAQHGGLRVFELLKLYGYDFRRLHNQLEGITPLFLAVAEGHIDLVRFLINQVNVSCRVNLTRKWVDSFLSNQSPNVQSRLYKIVQQRSPELNFTSCLPEKFYLSILDIALIMGRDDISDMISSHIMASGLSFFSQRPERVANRSMGMKRG